jgi:hypothetical protein
VGTAEPLLVPIRDSNYLQKVQNFQSVGLTVTPKITHGHSTNRIMQKTCSLDGSDLQIDSLLFKLI